MTFNIILDFCQLNLSTFFADKESFKEITAPALTVTNSFRGLAKITKNDVAPKRDG